MARAFGTHVYSRRPLNNVPRFGDDAPAGRIRIFLVAIHRPPLSPASAEAAPFEPMRVMRVGPGDAIGMRDPQGVIGPLPVLKQTPSAPREFTDEAPVRPRAVRGEILRDERGCLYEKLGQSVRPLHRIVSGPHGEVIDLVPVIQPKEPREDRAAAGQAFDQEGRRDARSSDTSATSTQTASNPDQPAAGAGRAHSGSLSRKLFPDPGQWCVVRFGDFKNILAHQLAHPERLRDTHRLACFAQVYEATAAQRFENMAAGVDESTSEAPQLHPLSDAAAHVLGLTRVLRNRISSPPHIKRAPGMVLPFDRFFRLRTAHDPTAEPAQCSDPRMAPESPAPQTPAAPRTAIPDEVISASQFLMTREEALCDIRLEANFRSPLRSLAARAMRLPFGRNQFRRWRALLAGKSAEQQLWSVRPPKGSLTNSRVRDWARDTLAEIGRASCRERVYDDV